MSYKGVNVDEVSAFIDQEHAAELKKLLEYTEIGLRARGITDPRELSAELEKQKERFTEYLSLAKEARLEHAGF